MEEHVDEDQMYVEFDGDDIPEFKESNGTRLFRFGVMRATKDELIMENIFDASTDIDVCTWIMPRGHKGMYYLLCARNTSLSSTISLL